MEEEEEERRGEGGWEEHGEGGRGINTVWFLFRSTAYLHLRSTVSGWVAAICSWICGSCR